MSSYEPLFFESSDGVRLQYVRRLNDAARATIIVIHGLGGYAERYTHIIDAYHQAGYSCFGLDQRGFGRSQGLRGHIDDFKTYAQDLAALIDGPVARDGRETVVVLGHSMGSVVGLFYTLIHPRRLAGLVVASTPLILGSRFARLAQPFVTPIAMIAPRMRFGTGVDVNHLSCDPTVVEAVQHDKRLVVKVTASWARAFRRACKTVLRRAGEITDPVMIHHGLDDRIASPDGGRLLYERISSKDKHLELYPGLRHELLNEKEPERTNVITHIREWIAARTGS